jgi:hypothetical protein
VFRKSSVANGVEMIKDPTYTNQISAPIHLILGIILFLFSIKYFGRKSKFPSTIAITVAITVAVSV